MKRQITGFDVRQFQSAYEREATRTTTQTVRQYVVEGFAFGTFVLVVLVLWSMLQP